MQKLRENDFIHCMQFNSNNNNNVVVVAKVNEQRTEMYLWCGQVESKYLSKTLTYAHNR